MPPKPNQRLERMLAMRGVARSAPNARPAFGHNAQVAAAAPNAQPVQAVAPAPAVVAPRPGGFGAPPARRPEWEQPQRRRERDDDMGAMFGFARLDTRPRARRQVLQPTGDDEEEDNRPPVRGAVPPLAVVSNSLRSRMQAADRPYAPAGTQGRSIGTLYDSEPLDEDDLNEELYRIGRLRNALVDADQTRAVSYGTFNPLNPVYNNPQARLPPAEDPGIAVPQLTASDIFQSLDPGEFAALQANTTPVFDDGDNDAPSAYAPPPPPLTPPHSPPAAPAVAPQRIFARASRLLQGTQPQARGAFGKKSHVIVGKHRVCL